MVPFIFKSLEDATWAEVNFNSCAARDFPPPGPNPLLNAAQCMAWEEEIRRQLGARYVYGGYLEMRDALWRGHYHSPACMRHLGLDLYAPAGTSVLAPCFGHVILSRADADTHGGWGGTLHIRMEWPHEGSDFLILGHLAHANLPPVGTLLTPGQVVGVLGTPEENGGWSPHLHVQLYNNDVAQEYAGRLEQIDGYGPNTLTVRPDMPDPTRLIMRPAR